MTIQRRMFLRGLGGITLAIPLLPSLLARAQSMPKVPTRYVQFISRFGQWPEYYYPATDAGEQVGPSVMRRSIANEPAALSQVLAPFVGLHGKITVIRGLDGMTLGIDHSFSMPTCASSPDENFPYSIDAVLEESAAVYPTAPRLRSLRVTPIRSGGPSDGYSWSWKKVGTDAIRIPHIEDSQECFRTIFGTGMTTPTVDDTPQRRRKKLTDLVISDYRRVMGRRGSRPMTRTGSTTS